MLGRFQRFRFFSNKKVPNNKSGISAQDMLVIGLGNPGKKYEKTRHNAGFAAVDAIAENGGFPEFRALKKYGALVSKGAIGEKPVTLAKPLAHMNDSGGAVKLLARGGKKILVIHDDIDLPLGTARLSLNKGSAGHKGAESIIRALGTKNFWRLRIGIRPAAGKPENTELFVLQKFPPEERKLLNEAIRQAITSVELFLRKKEEE